jgi:hypothetical protein
VLPHNLGGARRFVVRNGNEVVVHEWMLVTSFELQQRYENRRTENGVGFRICMSSQKSVPKI